MRATLLFQHQRHVSGLRASFPVRDECREMVLPHEGLQGRSILDLERFGRIHRERKSGSDAGICDTAHAVTFFTNCAFSPMEMPSILQEIS